MLYRTLPLLAIALTLCAPADCRAQATVLVTVLVTVSNVRNDHGVVRAALCAEPEFLAKHCRYEMTVPAHPGSVAMVFNDIPAGQYAVQAWHDEKQSGRIDRDVLGVPREGVGFSNDPRLLFGPPSFRDAAIPVAGAGEQAVLHLKYFKS